MKKFFVKHRKLLVTCLIVTCLVCCSVVFASAEEVDNTGGFGTALEQFISILVGGLESLSSGIGSGINDYVQNLFLQVDSNGAITGLSMFGGVAAIFGGVALAIGLTTLIFLWIKSLGNR